MNNSVDYIINVVVEHDLSWVKYRNGYPTYLKSRVMLLDKQKEENRILSKVAGDRRFVYMRYREEILSKKFPQRNFTCFIEHQESNDKSKLLKPTPSTPMILKTGSPFKIKGLPGLANIPDTLMVSETDVGITKTSKRDRRRSLPIPSRFIRSEKPPPPPKISLFSRNANYITTPKVADYTQFVGMYPIFSLKKGTESASITRIKFARNSRNIIAFSSDNHTLTIADVFELPVPPSFVFKGHSLSIVDFDWTLLNDSVVTCSKDKTLKVWSTEQQECVQTINIGHEIACCICHPTQANFVALGLTNGHVDIYNISTKKQVCHIRVESSPRCMAFSGDGLWLFLGCSDGKIRWLKNTSANIEYKYVGVAKTITGKTGRAISSISFRDIHSATGPKIPSLLINIADSTVRLYRVNYDGEGDNFISAWVVCPIVNVSAFIKSSFSSILTNNKEAYFATGSEDGNVYIYAYTLDSNGKSRQVDALQGHGATVLDLAWNADETLLCSGDVKGEVIVWKRVKQF